MGNGNNNTDMQIKIQDAALNGEKNTGSCRGLVKYLGHEDEERRKEGKEILPFTNPNGIPITEEEVVARIDRDRRGLSRSDAGYFHITVSPSADEIRAMGDNSREVYESALMYMKPISDAYAKNFHRDGITGSEDLEIFWKPHFTRGTNNIDQFHIHGIVRRKSKPSKGKSLSLSPMTTHRHTTNGPVTDSFDRTEFFIACEKIFDQLFEYERKIAETFDYKNAQVHGTTEEKATQAELLAREQLEQAGEQIAEGIARRKKEKKNREAYEKLAQALKEDFITSSAHTDPVENAFKKANVITSVKHIVESSNSAMALELQLMAAEVSCNAIKGNNGGIEDLLIIHRGETIRTANILSSEAHLDLMRGYASIYKAPLEVDLIRQNMLKTEAIKMRELEMETEASEVPAPTLKIGRGF